MVNEIVHVQVGQCGNQIANAFWSTMGKEHHLEANGKFKGKLEEDDNQMRLDKIDVYYQEAEDMRYVPRACLVDLDPGIMDVIKASTMGGLFKSDNMCFGASGTGYNWAKGYYTEGAELIDEAMDIIRRETEGCDCPQGFQLMHSIGGGTGGGMGTLLLQKIMDNYPERLNVTFTVFPSSKTSYSEWKEIYEPFNATLSIHEMLECAEQTFVFDNEALFNIAHNVLKQQEPKYADLNWLISTTMSGITASLRFSSKLNDDLLLMGTNLVPFPRLQFFLLAQAPLFAPGNGDKVKSTVNELLSEMWSSRNFLSNVKPEDGKYLTASCIFRGSLADHEVDPLDEIAKIQDKMADDFVSWIPDNIKSDILSVPQEGTDLSATLIANSTAIRGVFQGISACLGRRHKTNKHTFFPRHFAAEGMDAMELQEAWHTINKLTVEYQDKQYYGVDLSDCDDSEDDEEDEDDWGEEGEEYDSYW